MQKLRTLQILSAAYDLARDRHSTMQHIAKAAIRAIPRGPIAVAVLGAKARLDADTICFECADHDYISRFLALRGEIIAVVHELVGSLVPGVLIDAEQAWCTSHRVQSSACKLLRLCIVANTGDGGGIVLVAGESSSWYRPALRHLQEVASHLATAWRIRNALTVDDASAGIARDVLRRIVCHQDLVDDAQGSTRTRILWPELLDGSWSLLDSFTVDRNGNRYVVACQNPADSTLRALSSQERAVLDLALSGRSGKWTA